MALRALERLAPAALAATVVAFACGSSVVGRILLYGRPVRWICLAVLLAVALAYGLARRTRRRPPAFMYPLATLGALAVVSAGWSVAPRLTFERGATFAALLAAGGGLYLGAARNTEAVRLLLLGLMAGATAVALAGLVVLAVAYSDAVQPATYEYPARFRGLGQNPDTMALLFAAAVAPAVFFAVRARSRGVRLAFLAVIALFAGSISLAGSRSALLGGLVGALVAILAAADRWRLRLALAAVACCVFGVSVAISQIPQAKRAPTAAIAAQAAPSHRTLFTSGGRTAAWRGAIHQAIDRPILGYGFGTEAEVFVNRWASFASELPENSYIGASLQLGAVGLALLLAAAACSVARLARRRRLLDAESQNLAAACAGMGAAAFVEAITQSYLFSVGNVATATAWLSVFLLAATTELGSAADLPHEADDGVREPRRRRTAAELA
jgi:O-antigen ligase